MILKIFLFTLLLFTVSTAVPAQSKDSTALQNLVRQMAEAQAAFDTPTLEKITAADYIEISPLGEFDPREKMLGFYKPELKPKNLQIKNEADEFSIRSYGKTAVVIARLTYLMTMEGKPAPPRSIRATFVCRKEKGAWKIASAQYTSIRPPAAPQK